MFDRICTSCHKRQLIFPTQVTSMVNTDHGILVTYTCWCGATQEWQTGRAASERREVAVAA
jgi:RNase P subunit RPR2